MTQDIDDLIKRLEYCLSEPKCGVKPETFVSEDIKEAAQVLREQQVSIKKMETEIERLKEELMEAIEGMPK